MLKRLFTEHPATVDETYGQQMGVALGFSRRLFLAGLACLVHAVLPWLFVKTGSRAIAELHDSIVANRRGQSRPRDVPAPGLEASG
jgi:hypothetical protein